MTNNLINGLSRWLGFSACCALALMHFGAAASSDQKPAHALKRIADGFTSPIALVPFEDGSGRMLVVDQIGTVTVIHRDGRKEENLFFDVRDRLAKLNQGFDERGLIGLALHPKFKDNGKVYAHYSAPLRKDGPEGWDHTSHVSEFKVSDKNRLQVDPATEKVLLQIDQPYFNHNGGAIAFGPDGYLYISLGDGGNANDLGRGHPPMGNGQDTSTLHGSILRIDVNKGEPYAIPSDNPFAKGNGRPEIYAYGIRNIWGMSFDRGGKRELFAADVGQTLYEEVNIIKKGGNYGWNLKEGFHFFDPKNPKAEPATGPSAGASGEPLLDPIVEYKNIKGFPKNPEAWGICVIGGHVYRGKALPELQGKYVFADWTGHWPLPGGVLFVAARPDNAGQKRWDLKKLELASPAKMTAYIVGLGQDAEGEVYVLTNDKNGLVDKTGKVFKLVRSE